MSMHNDTTYLRHILVCIEKINQYTGDHSFSYFKSNNMIIDAVLRNFEIIGEASNNLSDTFKDSHGEIDFRSAIGIRNRLIHGYDEVNLEIVWGTIKKDLPKLKKQIQKLT